MKLLATTRITDEHLERLRQVSPEVELVRETGKARARELWKDADILFCYLLPGPLAEAERLKWIQLVSAGVDHLAIEELASRDLVVTTATGIHGPAIAEYVLCMMVMLSRRIPLVLRESAEHKWRPSRGRTYYGELLAGKTAGILGLGAVGGHIGSMCRCLGMTVLGVSRSGRPSDAADRVYTVGRLLEMLPLCDFVVVTLPLTAETRGLLGEREFAAMKSSACFINVARGAIVNEDELARALRLGTIAGAALDVMAVEPLPPESELWDLPNAVITPHMSGDFSAYTDRTVEILEENLRRYLSGAPLINLLDVQRGY